MCTARVREQQARQKIQSSGTTWQAGTPAGGAPAPAARSGGANYGSLLSTQVGKQSALGGSSLLGG